MIKVYYHSNGEPGEIWVADVNPQEAIEIVRTIGVNPVFAIEVKDEFNN